MRRLFVWIGGPILIPLASGMVVHAAQKPVIEESIVVDHVSAPASTAAMAAAASAVVAAKHTGAVRVVQARGAAEDRAQSTAYTFEIFDVLKSDPSLPGVGATIEVTLPGADRELPDRIVRARRVGVDDIVPGEVYVIFLEKNVRSSTFDLLWGPEGLYKVTLGKVRGLARGNPRHDGRDVIAFREALRAGR